MGPNRNQHRDNKASEFYRANKASSMTYNKKLKICLNIDPAYLEISQTDWTFIFFKHLHAFKQKLKLSTYTKAIQPKTASSVL